MNKKHLYITVYCTSLQYGGPEEGGWWYEWTEVDCSMLLGRKKRRHFKRLLREAQEYANWQDDGPDLWRSTNQGHYYVVVEHRRGSRASKERPYYC